MSDAPIQRQTSPVELTPRQVEVLKLMAGGNSAGQIARQLYVSTNTVKKASDSLYQRLGVHTQGAAVDAGHRLGFLVTPELEQLREMARMLVSGDVDGACALAARVISLPSPAAGGNRRAA